MENWIEPSQNSCPHTTKESSHAELAQLASLKSHSKSARKSAGVTSFGGSTNGIARVSFLLHFYVPFGVFWV